MNTVGNKPLENWVLLAVPLDSDHITVLLYGAVWSHPSTKSEGQRFFSFVDEHQAASDPSAQPSRGYHFSYILHLWWSTVCANPVG